MRPTPSTSHAGGELRRSEREDEDRAEWSRRLRLARAGAALGAGVELVATRIQPGSPFTGIIFDGVGLALWAGLVAFVSPSGRFRQTFPGGVPPGPADRVLVRRGWQWSGTTCGLSCLGAGVLVYLWLALLEYPILWSALMAWGLFFRRRARFWQLRLETRALESLETWGGLLFTRSVDELCAVACLHGVLEGESQSLGSRFDPVLVLGSAQLKRVPLSFFRANAEQGGGEWGPSGREGALQVLQSWSEATGVPALAQVITRPVDFVAQFQESGLHGLAVLGGAWSGAAPVEPSHPEPPCSLPPE